MDRAKVLDKIQKCLALSKSANEHEAAAAMRQAQALMRKYGVTDAELGTIGYTCESVKTTIQAGKKVPMILTVVVDLVRHAFGVEAVIERDVRVSALNFGVNYFGPEHRVMLAVYAHVVISRAVEKAWKQFLKENPVYKERPGGRAGFYCGWIAEVKKTVEEFAMTEEEQSGTNLVKKQRYGNNLVVAKSGQRLYSGAVTGGAGAADGFSLSRPVGNERLKLEKK